MKKSGKKNSGFSNRKRYYIYPVMFDYPCADLEDIGGFL